MIFDDNHLPDLRGRDIVFDLDGTLLKGDIGESVFLHLHIKNLLDGKLPGGIGLGADAYRDDASAAIIARYLEWCEAGQYDQAYRYTAEVIASYQQPQIHDAVRRILTNSAGQVELQISISDQDQENSGTLFSANFGVEVRPILMQLASSFKERGARLWIVSASPQGVVDACGEFFGFPPGNVFGAVVDRTTSAIERFPWKNGKVDVLRSCGIQKPLLVFGNGLEDLEMLQLADFPVVMEDGHPELVEHARAEGWTIYNDHKAVFNPEKIFTEK